MQGVPAAGIAWESRQVGPFGLGGGGTVAGARGDDQQPVLSFDDGAERARPDLFDDGSQPGASDRAVSLEIEMVKQGQTDLPGCVNSDTCEFRQRTGGRPAASGATYVDPTGFLSRADLASDGISPTEEARIRLAERVQDALRRTAQP